MKTTLMLDDALYRRAKVLASERGATVSSIVEEALRLMLATGDAHAGPAGDMPSWSMGRPHVDISDARALRVALDDSKDVDALR